MPDLLTAAALAELRSLAWLNAEVADRPEWGVAPLSMR